MRQTAFAIIQAAAVAAGLPESAVMHTPEKDGPTLPKRRAEISYLPEQYRRTGRPVRKRPSVDKEDTHRTLRREIYTVRLPVRVAIRSDDETWLRDFATAFRAALPKRTTDEQGNPVSVTVEKAEYGGFTGKLVEVFKKRSKTFHVSVTGMTTRDTEIPLVRDADITPKYREANNGQEEG
jgi:hypothetical protein